MQARPKVIRFRLFVLGMLAAAGAPAAGQDAPPSGAALASAPIDVGMFREGEVQRTTRNFAAWSLTCDEIPKLHRRYCSLSAPVVDAGGRVVALLLVSSGDDGRPAALLKAPVAISLRDGATVTVEAAAPSEASKVKSRGPRRVDFVRCDRSACVAVWTLVPEEVMGLNAGGMVHVKFRAEPRLPVFSSLAVTPAASSVVDASVSGAGFADAIQASVK